LFSLTIFIGFFDNFLASTNHCLVNNGSIIVLDLSPKGTLFFIDSILIQTSNKDVLKKRFNIWLEKLDEIVGNNGYEQRTFSYQVKKELFDKNPVCAISKQRILSIEDSEVDHILPFSKGGKTEMDNAQLVLRYFNRAKNNNENYQ